MVDTHHVLLMLPISKCHFKKQVRSEQYQTRLHVNTPQQGGHEAATVYESNLEVLQ